MGVEQTDYEKTRLYLLEEERTRNWLTVMQRLRRETIEEEAKEDYPNLITVVTDIMRPKDRVIAAQMEETRKTLREKEAAKKLWQKVMDGEQ